MTRWLGELRAKHEATPAELRWLNYWLAIEHPPYNTDIVDSLPDPLRAAANIPIGPTGAYYTGSAGDARPYICADPPVAPTRSRSTHGLRLVVNTPFRLRERDGLFSLYVNPMCILSMPSLASEYEKLIWTIDPVIDIDFYGGLHDSQLNESLLIHESTMSCVDCTDNSAVRDDERVRADLAERARMAAHAATVALDSWQWVASTTYGNELSGTSTSATSPIYSWGELAAYVPQRRIISDSLDRAIARLSGDIRPE